MARFPAYLDPGSGSFFLQLLIGVALGTLYTFKSSLRKLLQLFKRKPPPKK